MKLQDALVRDYKILHLKNQVHFQTHAVVQLNAKGKEIINATFFNGCHIYNNN